jgi:hypothetical protein
MEVLTATSMVPGRLVQTDTNEWSIKVQTSGGTNTLGVLDIEPAQLRTTLYDVGDQARVLSGPIIVLLTADSVGTGIAIGDPVKPADSGMIQKGGTAGADIGRALQVVAAATKANILVLLDI